MAGWACGIDFGTCFTTVAALWPGERPRLLDLDDSAGPARRKLLPSVVHLADGDWRVGWEAERLGLHDGALLIRAPKLQLGATPGMCHAGGRDVPAVDVCARVIGEAYTRACRKAGSAPRRVRVAHPAAWQDRRIDALREALKRGGVPRPELVNEPEAAARALVGERKAQKLPPGAKALIYDLGGGTCDIAILDGAGGEAAVLRADGLDTIGGEEFDVRFKRHISAELGRERPDVAEAFEDPDGAERAAEWRHYALRLLGEVTQAKELLTREQRASVLVLWPGADETPERREVEVSRGDLESCIADPIRETVETVIAALGHLQLRGAELHAAYLTGGSSAPPAVAGALAAALGCPIVAAGAEAKAVVALGAALPPQRKRWARAPWRPGESPFGLKKNA